MTFSKVSFAKEDNQASFLGYVGSQTAISNSLIVLRLKFHGLLKSNLGHLNSAGNLIWLCIQIYNKGTQQFNFPSPLFLQWLRDRKVSASIGIIGLTRSISKNNLITFPST